MSTGLRIGVDLSKLVGPADGIGTYTAHLCRALVSQAPPQIRWRWYGLPTQKQQARFRARWPELAGSGESMSRNEPEPGEIDVFHVLTSHSPRRSEVPWIFTCYDMTVLTHAHLHTVLNRFSWVESMLEAALGNATFVAISEATARSLTEQLGLTTDRIRVIHPAPAPAFRPLDRSQARTRVRDRFGLDGPYILHVGTLEPRKNLDALFEAYDRLDGRVRDDLSIVLVGGDGWRHEETDRRMRVQPTLRKRVRRLEGVPEADLVDLYNAATLFVYPSFAEGFGLPVAEALACGVPVVTSNTTSLPEVGGDAALYCDPLDVDSLRDAITRLARDDAERERLSALGLVQAARFSWERAAERTLALYEELAG